MRTVLVVAAAAVLAGGLGWVLLRERSPAAPGTPGPNGAPPPAPATGTAGVDALASRETAGRESPPPPGGNPKGRRVPPLSADDPRLGMRKSPEVPVDRMPASGIGEDASLTWTKEEKARVEALREKLVEMMPVETGFQDETLERVVAEVGRASGVTIVLADAKLGAEKVRIPRERLTAHDVLMQICQQRHLAFEVRPDKVVIKD